MEKRSVMIAFPGAAAPEEIQSDASTWGELKKQIESELGQDFYNQKVRDHVTNHHLSADEAILADEPLKLLVSTDKNKSGFPVTKGNYHKAKFSDLRTFCKKKTGFAPNGKDACIEALNAFYNDGDVATPVKEVPAKKAPKVVKETIAATPKKKSVEDRLAALEAVVFAPKDSFLEAAKKLS